MQGSVDAGAKSAARRLGVRDKVQVEKKEPSMKKMVSLIASVALFAAAAVQAQEVDVQGTGASGLPGDRVFVELSYDFGDSFKVIAEDFQLRYPNEVLRFVREASTVFLEFPVANPILANQWTPESPSLSNYVQDLQFYAAVTYGTLLEHNDPDQGIYNLSFLVGNGAHDRSGQVDMHLAFDIDTDAAPGDYPVSFAAITNLTNEAGIEFRYPASAQNLQVTVQAAVVPEPAAALMLLPGLALVGLHVRRRRLRQQQASANH
jgi:hypothetical protein